MSYYPVFHNMRDHFMLFTNPTNNKRGLLIGFKAAVQSFFVIKYCLNKKILKNKNKITSHNFPFPFSI